MLLRDHARVPEVIDDYPYLSREYVAMRVDADRDIGDATIEVLVRPERGTPTATDEWRAADLEERPSGTSAIVRAKIGPGSTWGTLLPGVYRLWAAVDTGSERVLIARSPFRVKA
jgi:hypothetical protein